jgi:hypothetical protein
MVDFCIAFIWIMVLVWPAIWLLLGLAYALNKILPPGTPLISDLSMDVGTSLLNLINNCASTGDRKIATRSAIFVSGFITGIIHWHLLAFSIVWVVLICVLLSAVEN